MILKHWLYRLSKIRSRQGLYEFLSKEFRAIRPRSHVLSVGAGGDINWLLREYAARRRFSVTTLDIDAANQPDIIGDICSHDFGDRQFDVIVIAEVLEHVHSPHLGVNNLYRALNSGGRLILTTPFMLPIHEAPRDYYRFTRYGLAFLLAEFSNVCIEERNSYFEAIDVLWLRLLQVDTRRAGFLSLLVIPMIYFVKRPVTVLLNNIANSNAMTTGYNVTALK